MAKILLKSGADPLCENEKGQTCLDLADEREKFEELFRGLAKTDEAAAPGDDSPSSSSSKRRKRDSPSMEKESRAVSPGKKGPSDASMEKEKGSGQIKAPSTVTTTSAPKRGKTISESQYEDISEDEEDLAAKSGTANVVSTPGLVQVRVLIKYRATNRDRFFGMRANFIFV